MDTPPLIVTADDARAADATLGGAKVAHLAALATWPRDLRPIAPPGVVVTTEAWVSVIAGGSLPVGDLLAAVDGLGDAPAGYAVRSSAVDEDGEHRSRAGRYHTELEVRREDVHDAVRRVMTTVPASAVTASVDIAIAVLIQPMVTAAESGVVLAEMLDPAGPDSAVRVVFEWADGADTVTAGRGHPRRAEIVIRADPPDADSPDADSSDANPPEESLGDGDWAGLGEAGRAAVAWSAAAARHLGHGVDAEVALHRTTFSLLQIRRLTAPLGMVPSPGDVQERTHRRGTAIGTGDVAGTVVGAATVLVAGTPDEVDDIEPGTVLVTIATDPSWVPFLELFDAVVTEQGGVASHAAIVCRELGVPAVVGCAGVTGAFRTGDVISIRNIGDGTAVVEGGATDRAAGTRSGQ